MKLQFYKSIGYTLILLILFELMACRDNARENKTDFETNAFFTQLINDWNTAHSNHNLSLLSNFYANSVLYYGTQKNKQSCIEAKSAYFKKYPNYFQQTVGEIETLKLENEQIKCNFVKEVSKTNNSENQIPSYLIFEKYGKNWSIVTEGDLITDKNIIKSSTANKNSGISRTEVIGD